MWSALTEMLILKKSALHFGATETRECCNNFIPTGIFTMSFQVIIIIVFFYNLLFQQVTYVYWNCLCLQYMALKCQVNVEEVPFEDVQVFLKFASVAVCDSSFLSFFDVRDNPSHIFTCVTSMGQILRKLVTRMKINFTFNLAEIGLCTMKIF